MGITSVDFRLDLLDEQFPRVESQRARLQIELESQTRAATHKAAAEIEHQIGVVKAAGDGAHDRIADQVRETGMEQRRELVQQGGQRVGIERDGGFGH